MKLGRYGIPLLLLLLTVGFSIARPESFFTADNYRAIVNNETTVVLLALAAIVPLIVGEFDLSVAAVLTGGQILTVGLAAKQGWPPGLAIGAALVACVLIGLVNGIVVVVLKVPAFVATLAVGSIVGGLAILYTDGETIFSGVPPSLTAIARAEVLGLPLPIVYTAATVLVLWLVLGWTPMGRRMYATGGNRKAALLTGIRTDAYVVGSFMASALLAGIAGVLLGARLGSASPVDGSSLLLPAFAGAFLGATTIRPGRFNVLGTVVAVYTLAITVSGLQQLGAARWFEPVFNGLALVVAVSLSGWAVRSRVARARAAQVARLAARNGLAGDVTAEDRPTAGSGARSTPS
jgi:ribose transport system permease protein